MESINDTVEKSWLAALAAGEEGALQKIFRQYYPLLLGDIYRIIGDANACKDVAQEVFVELWRKRTEIDVHTSLRAYLRRAAVNRALNYVQTQKRYIFEEADDFQEETVDAPTVPEEGVEMSKEAMEKALHEAIATLPEKCRIVFSLSRFEHLSHKEIAERLGISVKTIENQITKAMKHLRETMIRYRELYSIILFCIIFLFRA